MGLCAIAWQLCHYVIDIWIYLLGHSHWDLGGRICYGVVIGIRILTWIRADESVIELPLGHVIV